MVSTTKKRQQNKRFFSQLSERDDHFLIGQSNQDEQTESRDNMLCRGTSSDNASNLAQINYLQAGAHTLEENNIKEMRSEADNGISRF